MGVILAIALLRRFVVRPSDLPSPDADHAKNVFIAEFRATNPAIFGKSIRDVALHSHHRFVISRLWREGRVSIPTSDTTLQEGDHLLIVTSPQEVEALHLIFGRQEKKDWNTRDIDWNAVDRQLISQRILVTRPEINGRKLSSLRLRNLYGINISRVYRSGVQLLATPDLTLQLGRPPDGRGRGDGSAQRRENPRQRRAEPQRAQPGFGFHRSHPGTRTRQRAPGRAGPQPRSAVGAGRRPIVVGILMGTFGPRLHMITYTTQSANLMLRALGLSLYLACLGLDAGASFFATVMRPEGALWLALGFLVTFVPVVLVAWGSMQLLGLDFGSVTGILCGSMANPMALNYANDTIPGDNPSVTYATVYPICMFLRVVIVQVMLLFLL